MYDLTHPPATFMQLHQNCVAYANLQEKRWKRRAAGDRRHSPPLGTFFAVHAQDGLLKNFCS